MIFMAGFTHLFSIFAYAAQALGWTVKWLIAMTNIIVLWLEKLPFSFISGIQINEIETIFIFIAVAYSCNYFITRKQYLAKLGLFFFILVFLVNAFENYKIQHQKFITVYNINQTFAMQIFEGNKSIFIADTSLLNNSDKLHFHIRQHIWACGITKIDTIPYLNNLQISLNKTRLNIGKSVLPNCINILTHKTNIDTNLLKNNHGSVIISSKLKSNQAQTISKILRFKNISVNNVMENGAFTFNIEP
jgi:hypothetical protein